MAQTIQDVMTPNPISLPGDATVVDAARTMRDSDIGPVIVLSDGQGDRQVLGIVTDRDIVLRVIADAKDPMNTLLKDICSENVVTLDAKSSISDAVSLMKKNAVRRLPVVEDGHPVGIVSLGDLAAEREPKSALGKISQAAPNN